MVYRTTAQRRQDFQVPASKTCYQEGVLYALVARTVRTVKMPVTYHPYSSMTQWQYSRVGTACRVARTAGANSTRNLFARMATPKIHPQYIAPAGTVLPFFFLAGRKTQNNALWWSLAA